MIDVTMAARFLAAVCVATVGLIHVHLYQSGFSAIPTIGRLFLLNFATGVFLAAMLVLDRQRWVWAAVAAGYCVATLVAFLWSVEFGLFGYQEVLRGTWQERAAIAEVAGILSAATAVLTARTMAGGARTG